MHPGLVSALTHPGCVALHLLASPAHCLHARVALSETQAVGCPLKQVVVKITKKLCLSLSLTRKPWLEQKLSSPFDPVKIVGLCPVAA